MAGNFLGTGAAGPSLLKFKLLTTGSVSVHASLGPPSFVEAVHSSFEEAVASAMKHESKDIT